MTFPVAGFWSGERVEPSDVTASDAPVEVLLALGGAYALGRFRLSRAAERALVDLWVRRRPITSADVSLWVDEFDLLVGSVQRQQVLLASSYARQVLAVSGVRGLDAVRPDSVVLSRRLDRFLASEAGEVASVRVRRQVDEVLGRVASGSSTVADSLLADRLSNVLSPVVKVRTQAPIVGLDAAVDEVAGWVGATADNLGRAAERAAVSSIRWPTFKNGTPMLYARMPQGGACGWCRVVATRLYSAASASSSSAWHSGCRCSWRAVSESEARSYKRSFDDSGGDYFEAARKVGLWAGDDASAYREFFAGNRFDPAEAAKSGYVSRRWDERAGAYRVFDPGTGEYVLTTKRGSES